jgi:predicted ATPase
LLTCRDGEAPESVAALVREQAVLAITVGTLSESEVRSLVTASLAGPVEEETLARFWRTSLGNPLFLREIVRTGQEIGALRSENGSWRWTGPSALPPSLLELIERRLAFLGSDEQRVVELLAFAGTIGVGLLERLRCGRPGAATGQVGVRLG